MQDSAPNLASGQRQATEYDEQLNLVELAQGLWRRRWLIVAVTVMAVVIALALSLIGRPLYQANAKVLVPYLELAPGTRLTGSAFAAIVQGQDVSSVVVQEFALAQARRPLTVDEFRRDRVSVTSAPDTNLAIISVRLEDPNTAAAVANRLADLTVERVKKEGQRGGLQQLEGLAAALERSRHRLDAVESRLRDVEGKSGASSSLQELTLAVEFERTWIAYADLSSRTETARKDERRRIDQLRVFDRALPPTAPLAAGTLRRAAAGGLAAYFVTILGILLFDVFRATVLTPRSSAAARET